MNFLLGFGICVSIMVAFTIGATFGETMNFMPIKNAPDMTNVTGNWTYYDGSNTLIHCDCEGDTTVDIIVYGNIPSTSICGWFQNGTRLY